MNEIQGFEVLTTAYLGRDWPLFGATVDEAIVNFAHGQSPNDVAASIAGFEDLLGSSLSDEELDQRWIMQLRSGYDPRDDGLTYREWFAHALEVLRAAADPTG